MKIVRGIKLHFHLPIHSKQKQIDIFYYTCRGLILESFILIKQHILQPQVRIGYV
jgi:hypothetical protein